MVEHWVIVVFDCPVLFEFAFHFLVNYAGVFGLDIKPHGSARCGVVYYFAVFHDDFAVFDCVCCMFEGFACSLEFLGYVEFFRVNVIDCNVCICANAKMTFVW